MGETEVAEDRKDANVARRERMLVPTLLRTQGWWRAIGGDFCQSNDCVQYSTQDVREGFQSHGRRERMRIPSLYAQRYTRQPIESDTESV